MSGTPVKLASLGPAEVARFKALTSTPQLSVPTVTL